MTKNRVDVMENMRFKVLSFDVEGTLVTHRFSELIWEVAIPKLYSEEKGISADEALTYVMGEYAKVGNDRLEWYDITFWFNHFGLDHPETLLNSYKHEISYYPDVEQFLDEFRKKYRLIVISNSPREFLDIEIEKMRGYFYRVFSAPSDFRQVKTGYLYETICNILAIEPEELVHIGDHWVQDFLIPRKVGITSFYLDRKGEKQSDFMVKTFQEFKGKLEELENAAQ